jgi:pimeloyl-ACP methyl ester carboxylesterase
VLLRGLGRSQGHWGDFVPRFQATFPRALIQTPDLPGCGSCHQARAPGDVAGMLAAVRENVRNEGPLWVLGLSLGGMVAYEWARRYPQEIAGVVLISSSLGGLSPPWRRLRPGAVWHLMAAAATGDPLPRERRLHGLTSNRPDQTEGLATAWAELARREPVLRMNVVRQLLAAARYRASPEGLTAPLLVLVSQGDRMVDPSASRAIAARLPGAILREHSSAGHDLPLDDPDWVLGEIAAWLRVQRAAD